MACSITITSVTGSGPQVKITVVGTATDCDAVVVQLLCGSLTNPLEQSAPVDASGNWTVVFPETPCVCEKLVSIIAFCKSDPNCKTKFGGVLHCDQNCPTVSITVTPGGCNPDGTRAVTLAATMAGLPPGSVVTQWDFGDATTSLAVVGLNNTQTHNYVPGNYTANLITVLPTGCPPKPAAVTAAQCPPPQCPKVTSLTATVSGCADGGSIATASFSGTLSPPAVGCSFIWDFGDGTPQTTTSTPATTHGYSASGTFAVGVVAVCSGNCVSLSTVSVVIPPCCPLITGVSATVQGCIKENSTASATIIATTIPSSAPGTYTWNFDDGTTVITTAPTVVKVYSTSGPHLVTVTLTPSDPTCPASTQSSNVNVSDCGTDDGGDTEPFSCLGLRWAIVILTILAALAFYIFHCVPGAGAVFGWISLGFALTAAILMVIWLFLCSQPCGWGFLFAWQVALGSGIGALYFAPCCPTLWVIGSALIASALGLIALWMKRCRITRCRFLIELSIVITTVIVPVLGWIAGVPFLTACLNPIIAASVSTLAGIIAFLVAACAM